MKDRVSFYHKSITDPYADYISLKDRLNCIRSGFYPNEAVLYGGVPDPAKYVSTFYYRKIRHKISCERRFATDNKLLFHQALKSNFDNSLPTVFGIVRSGRVVSDSGVFISGEPNIWLQETVEKNNKVVCKPVDASSGSGVYIVEAVDGDGLLVNDEKTSIEDFAPKLSDQQYLVVQYVNQHSYSDNIYPGSVNSIRILAYRHPDDGEIFIPRAIHRFGTSSSGHIDNWSKGGLSAHIDVETGELGKAVKSSPSEPVDWITTHPDTDQPIEGVQIPHWEEVITKTKEMSESLQYLNLIGWDVALTEENEVAVLEGNSAPSMKIVQAHNPLLSDDKIREFYSHYGYAPS